jgi:hypothetical protein
MIIVKKILFLLKTLFIGLFLFFKNLFLIRILRLDSLLSIDAIIIEGSQAQLLWQVRGCHLIKIKNYGLLPGNTCGATLNSIINSQIVEITFYGITSRIKKNIKLEPVKIELKSFVTISELPKTETTYLTGKKLTNFFSELKIADTDSVKMNFPKVKFDYEKFEIENYKPINQKL